MTVVLPGPETSGVVYDLRRDHTLLEQIRNASLSSGNLGASMENGIVGSAEWWAAVDSGKVLIEPFTGTILRVDCGPMGDSAIIRIQGEEELKSWMAWEGFEDSLVGKQVDIRYARVPPKRPIRPGFVINLLVQVRVLS